MTWVPPPEAAQCTLQPVYKHYYQLNKIVTAEASEEENTKHWIQILSNTLKKIYYQSFHFHLLN
jgi:hypothetical protein